MDWLHVLLVAGLVYLWVTTGRWWQSGGYQPRENPPPRRPIDPGEPPKGSAR